LKVFVSVVPNTVDHLDLLSGNDQISAGAGLDTVVGDNYVNTVPLRTGISSIDQGFDLMTRSLYHLMYDLHNLELSVTGTSGSQPQELAIGNDVIDAGDDRDLVMSDNGRILSGMVVKSPADGAVLSQQLVDLQQVITAFNNTIKTVAAPGTNTQPYTLAIGNDQVSGSGGDDKLFADDTLVLEPIFRNPNYVRGSFWNYALIGTDKPARSDLREFNLKLGNDQMNGGEGNDLMTGGYSNVILPLVDRAPQSKAERDQLQRDLELLSEDAKTFIRDLHTTTHGIIYPNANQLHTLIAGNDTMDGNSGDDVMLGDNVTMMLPIINRQVDLNFELTKIFLDYGEQEHNFNQVLPHQFNVIYRIPGSAVTQLTEDTMFGGDGNDIMFGLRAIDRMNGNAGNDYLFGGEENDELTGGTGTNILRATNPSPADLIVINNSLRIALTNLLSPTVQQSIVELEKSKNDLSIVGDLQINFPD
jgi:Ca2+-binding RTX toxin-like protein